MSWFIKNTRSFFGSLFGFKWGSDKATWGSTAARWGDRRTSNSWESPNPRGWYE